MIHIGKYNILRVLRDTEYGLVLSDPSGEELLLPSKYSPEEYEIDEELEVFVYLGNDNRKIATSKDPKIFFNEFAFLWVAEVNEYGAFLDWGMDKELFVPYSEQPVKMEAEKGYVVYLDLDERSQRLYASCKIEKRLNNEHLDLAVGDEVEILIYKKTELGYSAIINHRFKGLIFISDVFQELRIGESRFAYIKAIHPDKKVDLSLQAIGYENNKDANSLYILDKLHQAGGTLSYGDKSSPEDIYAAFQMSKKAFKRAIGDLYKQRKIRLSPNEIQLTVNDEEE